MAVRARPGIRTARIAGGLVVAGTLLLAAPATAFAQETTPAPPPAPTAVRSVPPQVTPAPGPPAPPLTRAAEPAPPTVLTARPTPAEAPGRPGQVSRVPVGAPETGGGATAPGPDAAPFVIGGVALLGAAGAATAMTVRRRRSSSPG